MADLEPVQPSLCQRICCCMTASVKEPPVQLIRSGAIQVNPTINGHISAAENTINGFEEISLEGRSVSTAATATASAAVADTSKPRVLVQKERDAINMNDIMMEQILGDDKPDEVDTVVEDAISISTNVVEEVDESELSRLRLQSPAQPQSTEECHLQFDGENAHESEVEDNHDDNVVSKTEDISSSMETPSTSKEEEQKQSESDKEPADADAPEVDEFSVNEKDEAEDISEQTEKSAGFTENHTKDEIGPSVIHIVPNDDESDTEEEIMLDVAPPVQKAFDPPSIPPKSIMYADTSSSEDSDDESSQEVLPPVQRSQRIMNIDQLRNDQIVGHMDKESTLNARRINPTSDTSSDEDFITDVRKNDSVEEGVAVTRIMVRNDGRPDVLSSGGVKLNLDAKETVTDEEFSEKLI